jgi:hypothetical protein
MYTGDECETCVPTKGWEILNGECPQGYTELDEWIPFYSCTYRETPYCCTEDHNGTQGTCPNLVVNPITKQCALNVENKILATSYRTGWIPSPFFMCSKNYEWTDSVNNFNDQWNYISIAILVVMVMAVAAFILLFRRNIKHDDKPPNKT